MKDNCGSASVTIICSSTLLVFFSSASIMGAGMERLRNSGLAGDKEDMEERFGSTTGTGLEVYMVYGSNRVKRRSEWLKYLYNG